MNSNLKKSSFFTYLSILSLTIVSGALGLVLWFIIRDTMLTILIYTNFNGWKVPAIDNFSFLILGIAWLIFILVIHHQFTKGIKKGILLIQFFIISGGQLLLLSFCEMLMVLLDSNKNLNIIIISELIVGILLIVTAIFIKRQKKSDITTNINS